MRWKVVGVGAGPRTLGTGTMNRSAGEPRELPLRSIELPRPEERVQHTPSRLEIERAASSLEETGGLLHPLTVRPRRTSVAGAPAYELVCGRLRLEAARALGWDAVPCLVMDLDDRAARRVSLIEDMCRKNVPELLRAWQIEDVLEGFDGTQQDLAAVLAMSPSQISEAAAFAAAVPRESVAAVADAAETESERLAHLSRTALRRLKAAPAEERRALLEHAAREVAEGRKPRLPRKTAGRSTMVLGDGVVRVNRTRMRELGVLGTITAVLASLFRLVLTAIPDSRIFAAVRGAKTTGTTDS